ncbi:MAG: DUF2752 domain-containing protein [Saprospiraceae bacterium]|nr:DUF2752 domain-containing protein [Saprospiraceae bacterium]
MIILALIPIALWIVPAGQFDDTGVVLCPSRFLFDIECPGCGITRAILHFHHWDFDEAVYHNMFVLIIYPLLFLLWLYWMYHILINLGWIKKRGSDKV